MSAVKRAGGRSLAAAAVLMVISSGVSAQTPGRWSVTLAGGPSAYDLSGTGTGLALAGRLEYAVTPTVGVEGSLNYFRYRSQGGVRFAYLMPEAELVVGPWVGRFRPFVGVGAGMAGTVQGPSDTEFTANGAAGLVARVPGWWQVRGELRVRSVDPFTGTTADMMIGVSRAF